jgi:DNA-binding response OmpR family regulator
MARSLRILVIEDNGDQRAMMQLWLQQHAYEVLEAANGREGLEMQRRTRADIVIVDLFMPEKDGIETIDELRKEFADAKIIAMSGFPSKSGADFLRVARQLGADVTLEKPFDLEDLIVAVRTVLSGAASVAK